jgi:hypothetical protein
MDGCARADRTRGTERRKMYLLCARAEREELDLEYVG